MSFKLYQVEASPPVRAVLMTAEALKLNFESYNMDMRGKENMTPEYLEKNPVHTIPMLEEDDFCLADSHAIITYLASKYGDEQSKLYPSDLRTRATIDQRLFFEATVLNKASSALIYGVVRDGQKVPTPKQIQDVIDSYEILDKYLQKTKYVACDYLTVADFSCIASISSTDYWVPVGDKFPKVKAWMKTLEQEDWYKKGNLPGLTVYQGFMNTFLPKQ